MSNHSPLGNSTLMLHKSGTGEGLVAIHRATVPLRTLVGSMIPAAIMSQYSPVAALCPISGVSTLSSSPTTTAPSTPAFIAMVWTGILTNGDVPCVHQGSSSKKKKVSIYTIVGPAHHLLERERERFTLAYQKQCRFRRGAYPENLQPGKIEGVLLFSFNTSVPVRPYFPEKGSGNLAPGL